MYQSDSLQIQVIASNDESINHHCDLMIVFNKGSRLCIVHLNTHQGGCVTLDEGKKRYTHPQYLLRSGHTKNKHAGKEHILLSLFQVVIVTNPLQNVVHYQPVTILKHIRESLRLCFFLI